ncbi:MAG TPA: AraC family transcriptional regulator [Fimbriimonadaceae bacterium]|nr:AraC family transcriptional regulator [Fimbriimonadaceae bacterium]
MKESTYRELSIAFGELVRTIHAELDEPRTIEFWAGRCCLSEYHFQRLFTQIAGESCMALWARLRLERAAWMLQHTEEGISEIALLSGFSGIEAFARAFRREFAMTAGEFREAKFLSHWMLTPNQSHFTPDGNPRFVPLAQKMDRMPFRIERVERFDVATMRHEGPPQLIGKTCLRMAKELSERGIDVRSRPFLTFARRLSRYTPVSAVESYAAVPAELIGECDYPVESLGGCSCLTVGYRGTGQDLGDFWMRMWAEALPSSGREQLRAPCFQRATFETNPDLPNEIEAQIFVPVREKGILG